MSGNGIVPSDHLASAVYQSVANYSMPKASAPLSQSDLDALASWIDAGALADQAPPTVPPEAPTMLTAMASSRNSIMLNWTLPSLNLTSVTVERSLQLNGSYSPVLQISGAPLTFTDNSVLEATQYFYRVFATNSYGNSSYSNIASATTPGYPPNAPSQVTASLIASNSALVTWLDNSADETGMRIERSPSSSGPFTTVATLPADSISLVNGNLSASTSYFYRVVAFNNFGDSGFSNLASITTPAPPALPPNAPTNLIATAASPNQINLSWIDQSLNESGFILERGSNLTGPFSPVVTLSANATSFANSGVNSSTTYYYRIQSFNSAGSSNYSATANASTPAPPASAPLAPSNLLASALSQTQISLSWNDNSNNESGFLIQRSLSSSQNFQMIVSLSAGVTTYTDSSLSAGTGYSYRVLAVNSAGSSSPSNTATTSTLNPLPAPPTGLTAIGMSTSQINLSWTDVSNNETGFVVQRSTSSSGSYVGIATLSAGSTSYSNSGLATATRYYYRVYSTGSAGNSSSTTPASAMTDGSFSWLNANIFQSKCLSCHGNGAGQPKGNYDMRTYSAVMTGVVATQPLSSSLYARTADGSMPKTSTGSSIPLSSDEINAIYTWILRGAANN